MVNARRLALALVALAAAALSVLVSGPAAASPAPVGHVVVVGLSGLRWSEVRPGTALWNLAGRGSPGGLVDYAENPVACPADGWLTLNSGARAAAGSGCGPLPRVIPDGTGASIPSLPGLVSRNAGYHQSPDWGLLGRAARCTTAVGPGAALALAAPDGRVRRYVPSPARLTAATLARCPLTVVDLGQQPSTERIVDPATDQALSRIEASLPPDTLLLVTSPGTASGTRVPHLMATVVTGPGYERGLLAARSTRQPGIVALTDLTPTVAHWLGKPVPGYLAGSVVTRGDRSSLAGAVSSLAATDAAEQVWRSTHTWFFVGYAAGDVLLLGVPALLFWGGSERNRRRRAACWRVTGTIAAAVPAATFLAGMAPWAGQEQRSVWLYGLTGVWTAALAGLAFAGRWRRDPFGPPGVICLVTVAVLGIDVMTGSRLQLQTPFGLSLLESGRYYGLGNDVIGVYGVAALVAAWYLGQRRGIAFAAVIALFAVVSSGWPGFGAKVGGTIAMVPAFAVLLLELAGIRLRWRYAAPVAASGLVLVAAFGLVTYFVPAIGVSDIGAFAGNLLHGHGGSVLERKASSNLGSLTVTGLAPLVPVGVALTGLALWRPAWFRLRLLPRAFEACPLLRVAAHLVWLVLVIGWLADDSGVIVPAVAAPFAIPLVIAMAASPPGAAAGADIVTACSTSSRVLPLVPCSTSSRWASPG